MDSKEILETSGLSKNFAIILFIQSIIVVIGCFFAFQDMYNNIIIGTLPFVVSNLINLILFIFLIYYSFIGFKKDEKYFKILIYLYMVNVIVTIIAATYNILTLGINYSVTATCNLIILILVCYFVNNLNNFKKAKTVILLVVLIELIIWILMTIVNGTSIEVAIPRIIYIIPSVSIALNYFARYNNE